MRDDCLHSVRAVVTFDIEDTAVIQGKWQHTIVGAVTRDIVIFVDCCRDLEWRGGMYVGEETNFIGDISVGATIDKCLLCGNCSSVV